MAGNPSVVFHDSEGNPITRPLTDDEAAGVAEWVRNEKAKMWWKSQGRMQKVTHG